jgi:biotin carboxylase
VLKPADSGGQRGLFLLRSSDDLDAHLHVALAESPGEEAIVESYHEGLELNGLAVARGGEVVPLTLSDRLRPPGIGFGVGWIHVYPASIYGDTLAEAERVAAAAVRVLGLRDGIAFPQLLVDDDGSVRVVEVAARIPGGQMADLARHAIGIDLVEVALRQALGIEVPDELARPRFSQPLAIRFLTADPGPLPTGLVERWSGLERVLAFPGVVQADVYLQEGETIRPVRLDGDRRGYVIAVADTSVEALDRAERAARLLEVEIEPASLAERWQRFARVPFPSDDDSDVFVDLAEYDGYAGGLIATVANGDRPAYPLRVDEELTRRVEATGSEEHIAYVRRLNELIERAREEIERVEAE